MPPNSTATLQPLDQGVIRSFKAHFTSYKLNDIIEKAEQDSNVYKCFTELKIKYAIMYAHMAWESISQELFSIVSNIQSGITV